MSGFIPAIRSEWHLARHGRWPRILVILPAVAAFARIALSRLRATAEQVRGAIAGGAAPGEVGGYGALVDGLSTALVLLSLLLAALAASSLAADREQGTARQLVVRCSSRSAWLAAKLVALLVFGCLAASLAGLSAWGAASWLHELGPVIEDGYELIGVDEIHDEVRRGVLLAIAPLPATIAFGLLVSVLSRSPVGAVSAALGALLAFDLFKGLVGDGASWVWAYHVPSLLDASSLADAARLVRGYSDILPDEEILRRNLLVPGPTALILLAATFLRLRRREL